MDALIAAYRRLLSSMQYTDHRYMYDTFTLKNRLTGLIGPRGTGKTTLLLQYIKEKMPNKDECMYASIDNLYFSSHSLTDFVRELYDDYGVRYYFFDEIHKYWNWNQELKNIYDGYPDIKIVFSGSSSIDLVKGAYDLSRRAVLYRICGMSFREYLLFNEIADIEVCTLDDIVGNNNAIRDTLAGVKKIKGYFKEYLGSGYYPFYLEDADTYHQKIVRVIEKILYEDIANFYSLKTENLLRFKRILAYLATIPPSELNKNNISKHIGLDNKTVHNYLSMLHETGLTELVATNKSGSSLLKQTEKIYLHNPDVYCAITSEVGREFNTGTLREIFFLRMLKDAGYRVSYSKEGDFEVDSMVFEIGGKNKTRKQIRNNLHKSYLVKDDILYGRNNEIPLFAFGFLY